jgi:putative transposase
MNRVPPSQRIRQAIRELLEVGIQGDKDVLNELIRLGSERLVQEVLEQEVDDFLGRRHYEHRGKEGEFKGYRNGYREKEIASAEGNISVAVPQLRQTTTPFESKILTFLRGHTDVLDRLVAEMYARGLSTRDIEEAFKDSTGDRLLSRTAVSQVTESLWAEYEAFRQRDLSHLDVAYLFLDAVFEALRRTGQTKEGVLCAWAILTDGRRVLLHLGLGNKESYENWLEFLRDMVKRGLKTPTTITTDGAPGLIKAVEAMWPKSLRIRCWAHKARNILDKVPDDARPELKAFLQTIREAPTLEAGRLAAQQVIERYKKLYPSAMQSLEDDLEASLAHLQVPVAHRKFVRTTNLIERSFEEERRRTKTLPKFFGEHSALKLVFAALSRATRRWQRVHITELEQKQMEKLRQRLGLDPEPTSGKQPGQPDSEKISATA